MKSRTLTPFAAKFAALLLLTATALTGSANTINWTNAAGGNWNTATNWNPNTVPGASDTAIITNNGTYTVTLDVSPTVGGITLGGASGTQTLSMNGQGLGINGTFTVNANGSYTLDSGTLGGNTGAVLSGTFGWVAGHLAGNLTLAPGSVLNITTGNDHNIYDCILTNNGTVVWNGGNIQGGGGSPGTQIYNNGLWDSQTDQTWNNLYGANGTTWNNAGTLRKSGTSFNSTVFNSGVFLNNTGKLDSQTNYLTLQGGGNFAGGTATNLNGFVYLNAGPFTINGTVTSTNVQLAGGFLSGNNVINGGLNWVFGDWNNSASETIAPNSTLLITSGNDHNVQNCTITNNGTVAWIGGSIRGGGNPGTTVYNNGLWDSQTDQTWNNIYGGAGTTWNNAGTLRKSGTSFNSTVFNSGVFLNNTGKLDSQTNYLTLQGGGNFTGGTATNLTGFVSLNAGPYTINGTVTSTNVQLTGGFLTGDNVFRGAFNWIYGVWNNSASETIAANATLLITSPNDHDVQNCTITNNGTVAWIGGSIRGGGNPGTTVYNNGLWDCQSDQAWNSAFGGNGTTFNNLGTMRKSGTSLGYTFFSSGAAFNQISGIIDTQQGGLVLQGGGNFIGGYTTTNSTGATYLSVGSFTINGTVTSSNVIENAASLTGNNVIRGALTWIAGLWNGSSVTITTNSAVTLAGGGGDMDMANCNVTNYGTFAWASGNLRGGGNPGSFIYNYGLWDCQSDRNFNSAYGGTGVLFNNYGILRKSGGAGEFSSATIFQGGIFINQLAGMIDVQNGTNGLELAFQGSGNFNGGYITTNVSGLTVLSVGLYNINGTVTGTNTWQNNGSLTGTNVIRGALTWVGGNWNGTTTTISTNCTVLVVGGGADMDMASCTFTNYGTLDWISGQLRGGSNPGTFIYNYGLFDCQSDRIFNAAYNGAGVLFNNYGILRKSGGAGEFSSATIFQGGVFINQLAGVIDVQNGTNGLELAFQGSGNFNGGYITTNTSGLTVLSLGGYNINGTVTGTNTWENNGSLTGTNVIRGALTWVGGNWNGSTVSIATNSTVLVVGGGADMDMASCTFTNYGTLDWISGQLRGGSNPGTFIYNYGLFDCQSDRTFNSAYNGAGVALNNYGTFRKSLGTGTTLLDGGVSLYNTGTVGALSGSLNFNTVPTLTGGTLSFGIGSPTNVGHIGIANTAILDGGIGAVLLNGYVPSVGTGFDVMSFANTNGTFIDYTKLNAGSGVAFTPSLTSTKLTLTAVATNYTPVAPTIISQPGNQTVSYGSTVSFQVGVSGSPTLQYQWSQNNTPLSGANSASLTLSNVTFAQNGSYTVTISNSLGGVVSQPATLTVQPVLPAFTSQPATITVPAGSNATFNVTVVGGPAPTLQWLFNGAPLFNLGRISGVNTTSLSISNLQFSDAGNYSVVASNAYGVATSSTAILHVGFPDIAPTNIVVPGTGTIGQTLQVVFTITNSAAGKADGPWQNQFLLAQDAIGTGKLNIGTATFNGTVPGFGFAVVTQSVILPVNVLGTRYVGVVLDSSSNLFEVTKTNNTSYGALPVVISGADLVLNNVSAPGSAQFGQSVNVSFAVTNLGGSPASSGWSDQIYLSTASNSLSGATLLSTVAGTSPLATNAGYTRTQSVTIPVSASSTPGTYYLVVSADAGNTQLETNESNNLLSVPISLALPPLPDLVAGQVISPTNGAAGGNISISWAITNIGNATATSPWKETAYLLPTNVTLQQFNTNISAYTVLGVFTYTNNLSAGVTISRTQQVSIPFTGLSGTLNVAIVVNNDGLLLEQNFTNNSALALNNLTVPATLSLFLPVSSVPENTASPAIGGLVSRNGSTASAATVSLASSAMNHLLVPATVTIPAGAASAPFTFTVLDDGIPTADSLVTITAGAASYLSATSQVLVVNTEIPALSLSLASSPLTMGQSVLATLTSSFATNQPVVVTLSASTTTALAIPATVTIPANSNSVTFPLLAVQTTFIAPAQTYTVNATATNYTAGSTTFSVLNNNAPTLSLVLNRTNITEADGAFADVGTVSRTPITDQPVTISLGSTNTGAAIVPSQAVIPALQGSVSFYVAAVNDTNITGQKTTLITAQAQDSSANLIGTAASQVLFVQDLSGPALTVTIANKVVSKGVNPATTATVSVAVAPTTNVTVSLSSSATSEATVPASVTLLAGHTNVSFNIASLNDGIAGSSHNATITASANLYSSGSDVLTVSDLGLPDLIISSITAPATGVANNSLTIGFRLLNQGLGTMTNGVSQNVYLTLDPVSGVYLPLGSVYFPGPLAPGQFVDLNLIAPGNLLPAQGSYYVAAFADANNNAVELNELNNNTVSKTTVSISPEYSVTVKAGVTNGLMGMPVPLTGSATLTLGGPATNRPVEIYVTVRGLARVLDATTDANGNYSTVFTPLANEAGTYTVGAVFPGVTNVAVQDQFNLLGISASPKPLAITVNQSSNKTATVTLENLSDAPLTGVAATVSGLAGNLAATATLDTNNLAGEGLATLSVKVIAGDASIRQSSFTVHLVSSEGATLDVPVNVTVVPLLPLIVSSSSPLTATMLRGSQTVVQFDLVNNGGANSGQLAINLPAASWLSVVSTNPMPSLVPGATNHVMLLLSPDANMALGPYSGSIQIVGSATSLLIPFTFTAVSDAHGSLIIHSVDEYTYFATGSPPLTNANVQLINPFTQVVVAHGTTDTNGYLLLTNIMEGAYELDLSADQHSPFRGEAVIAAGRTNSITSFLPRQTVTYVWTVVPTTILDTNHITIDATFETDVPAPVVVPSPASIDLAPLTQPGQFIDIPFTLVNYGLIAVNDVKLNIGDHPLYRF